MYPGKGIAGCCITPAGFLALTALPDNPPPKGTAAAVYFTCGPNVARAPPRPLNGFTLFHLRFSDGFDSPVPFCAIYGVWEAEDRPEVRPHILIGGALVVALVFALWYALR